MLASPCLFQNHPMMAPIRPDPRGILEGLGDARTRSPVDLCGRGQRLAAGTPPATARRMTTAEGVTDLPARAVIQRYGRGGSRPGRCGQANNVGDQLQPHCVTRPCTLQPGYLCRCEMSPSCEWESVMDRYPYPLTQQRGMTGMPQGRRQNRMKTSSSSPTRKHRAAEPRREHTARKQLSMRVKRLDPRHASAEGREEEK